MRWIWIDKFVQFESGVRAAAVKNVTRAEEYLYEPFPGCARNAPVFPPVLMIEGMAQTAGILVGEASAFKENVILAKIRRAEFTGYAGPGDQLRFESHVESLDERAAATSGTVFKNGEEIGRVDLIFSHVNRSAQAQDLPQHNFVFTGHFTSILESFLTRHNNTIDAPEPPADFNHEQ